MILRIVLLIVVLLGSLPVALAGTDIDVRVEKPGEPLLVLDLQRAIALALEKNFQIDAAGYLPDIARQRQRAASGAFDPELQADFTRTEDTNRALADPLDLNRPLSLVTQRDSARLGVNGLLPWGMTYDAGLGFDVFRSTNSNFASTYTGVPEVSVTQPLLRGFGFSANLAQIRIARTNRAISDWQLRQTVIDVVTNVIFFYHELRFAEENLGVAQRSMDLAQRLLEDNNRRAEIGVMSPLDITTARAQVAERKNAVLLAERSILDNENFLKQLITNDIEQVLDLRVQVVPPPASLDYEVDVKAGIKQALELRPDYQQALLDIRRRGISIAFTRNQALPRIDLVGSLRLLGTGGNLNTSIDRAAARDQTSWTAGVVGSFPIPNRTALGNLQSEKLERTQALVNLKALEQNIVISVDNTGGGIKTSRQRVIANREAKRLAWESLDAGNERLKAGTGTTYEVSQLQDDLARAEVAEIRSLADFYRSVAEYERQTGVTLGSWQIIIDDL